MDDIFTKHPQWNDVKKICAKLREQGFTAWLAGGCVRDGLLGIVPKDFDIATNARPKKIETFFNKTVDVGKAFGVIRVVEPSGDIEVATFRKDGAYIDGRHPTSVELSTPEEDAKRRDFTVNAMFYDIFEKKIHDFVGGQQDLKSRIIRTVGIPVDRFMEDKLRILRAVRFVSQLDFDLDQATLEAVSKYSSSVTGLAWERIGDELSKLFAGVRPDRGMELLMSTGLLDELVPEYSARGDELTFFKNASARADREILGWAYLFQTIEPDKRDEAAKRMKLSNDRAAIVRDILELALSVQIFDRLSLAEKKRAAADPCVSLALSFVECSGQDASEAKSFTTQHPGLPARFIEASDVMALGVKPGKQLGEILEAAYDAQLEETVRNKGEALQWIKKKYLAGV